MERIRIFSRKWLREIIDVAHNDSIPPEERLKKIVYEITSYIDYLSEIDRKRVSSTSEKKSIASRNNGKLGGRPRKYKTDDSQ